MLNKNLRWALIGLLVVFAVYLCFMAGLLYSCRGGNMYRMQCVEPKLLDIIQVCEYDSDTCCKTCSDMILEDKAAFYQQYTPPPISYP